MAKKIKSFSKCEDYELFMCNSGAEANENSLQIASFHTKKSRIIAFKNSFHGRSNAALSSTDYKKIKSELNKQINVTFLKFNDHKSLEKEKFKAIGKKMSRNEPCHCGSGKKFKHCQGNI